MSSSRLTSKLYVSRCIVGGMLYLVTAHIVAADILVLGLFKDMAIIRIDEAQHKLRPGEISPEGVKLISADSEAAVLEINGVRQTYTLGSHQSASSFQSKKTFSEARVYANHGMFMTSGLINGQPVSLLVDTGASSIAMSTAHADWLGINYRYSGKKSAAGTASGVVNTWLIKLKTVKVGDIEIRDVEGAVIEGQGPSTILLGMSFLQHVKMQREGNLLQLQQKN